MIGSDSTTIHLKDSLFSFVCEEMQNSDGEKPGGSVLARSTSDIAAGIPIKKRLLFLVQSLSSPLSPSTQVPSSPTGGFDVAEKKPGVLEQDFSPSVAGVQTASEASLTAKGIFGGELRVKGSIDITKKDTVLPEFELKVESEIVAGVGPGMSLVNKNFDDKYTLHNGLGSTQLISALKDQTFTMPIAESKFISSDTPAFCRDANVEFQLAIKGPFEKLLLDGQNSEGSSPTQEKVNNFSSCHPLAEGQHNHENMERDAKSKADSTPLSIDRSSWDLNTTMDNWEISSSDSAINVRPVEQVGLEPDGMNKGNLGLDSVQMNLRKPKGTDWNDGRCMPLKGEHKLVLSDLSTTVNEQYNCQALSNLQLKPSFIPEQSLNSRDIYSETNSIGGIPILSLSRKPMSYNDSAGLATRTTVKPEPHKNCSKKDRRKVEVSSLSLGVKHVKFEPLEGSVYQGPKATCSGDDKFAFNKTVKSEPWKNSSYEYPKGGDGKSSGMLQHSRTLMPCNTEVFQDMSDCVNKALGLISESIKANIQQDASKIAGDAPNLVPKAPIPENDQSCDGEKMSICRGVPQVATLSEPSNTDSKSLISKGEDLSSIKNANPIAGLSIDSRNHVSSGGNKDLDANHTTVDVAQIGSMDGESHKLSVLLADKYDANSYGNGEAAECCEMDISEGDMPDSSHGLLGAINSIEEACCSTHCQDAEARNRASHAALCEGTPNIEAANSIPPLCIPNSMPSHLDNNGSNVGNINKLDKDHGTHGGDLYNNKDDSSISTAANSHGSSDAGVQAAVSDTRRLLNTTHVISQDHLKKDKGLKTESKSNRNLGSRTTIRDSKGEAHSQQEDSKRSDQLHARHSVLSKSESLRNGDISEHAKDRGRGSHSQTDITDSSPRKPKSISNLLITSKTSRERLIDKSPRRVRLHSRGSRDDNCNGRSRSFGSNRYEHWAAGKSGSDLVHIRRNDDNQLGASHGDRISDLEHCQGNILTSARFPRAREPPEVGIPVTSNGFTGNSSRLSRMPTNDELQCFSRMALRRQSSGGRGQVPCNIPMVRHPIRDVSPARCIGRNIPDFVPLIHEEKLMRALPDEMMDPHLLAHPLPPYEQVEGVFIRRGRMSLSPIQQRGPPLQIAHICLESSPRSHAHVPPQWTSPQRSPDGFDGHPEIIRCRSPPILTRMRSPQCLPFLPEDVLMRRHGSPPYMDRLPGMMNIGSSREHMIYVAHPREHEFPRPIRGSGRTIQRFDLIDPREIAEGECFGPLFHSQGHEIAGEECIDDRRNFGERHGLVRSIRQRLGPPDNDSENVHFRGEDGPPRPARFCPEPIEEFPERIGLRDVSRRIRNRLGNLTSRPRGIEEQEDGCMHHEQGWRDAASNDLRLKRRRF